jgi:putative oxidoreductase
MEILNHQWSERMLRVLRIFTALLYLQHGMAKLFGFPHVAMFDNLQLVSLIGVAGLIELIGSVLLLLGLFTRLAAFIMSGEMAVAYFMTFASRSFFPIVSGGELAALFSFLFLYFAVAGGGAWSLDQLRSRAVGGVAGRAAQGTRDRSSAFADCKERHASSTSR